MAEEQTSVFAQVYVAGVQDLGVAMIPNVAQRTSPEARCASASCCARRPIPYTLARANATLEDRPVLRTALGSWFL